MGYILDNMFGLFGKGIYPQERAELEDREMIINQWIYRGSIFSGKPE